MCAFSSGVQDISRTAMSDAGGHMFINARAGHVFVLLGPIHARYGRDWRRYHRSSSSDNDPPSDSDGPPGPPGRCEQDNRLPGQRCKRKLNHTSDHANRKRSKKDKKDKKDKKQNKEHHDDTVESNKADGDLTADGLNPSGTGCDGTGGNGATASLSGSMRKWNQPLQTVIDVVDVSD